MSGITYSEAGVDIEAGDKAVELMKTSVKKSLNNNVLEAAGGFAGMFDITDFKNMKHPILSTSTDGVGTKVQIAQKIDKHDTVGYDLVGMVVDDIAVTGAKPLFMTDYICTGKVIPERIAEIVKGVADACIEAGTALVGGETAEHPGLLGPDEYDIAGAATGIIDRKDILGPERVKTGDVIVAIESSGLHSNGFSLVRKVFANAGWDYKKPVVEFDNTTLGEVLLTPTKIYSALCLELAKSVDIHTFSHITGGGIASNLARVLPLGSLGIIDRITWEVPAIFKLVQDLGNVPQADLEKTLNMGIGMLAVLPEADADKAIAICKKNNTKAWICGSIVVDSLKEEGVTRGTKGIDGGGGLLVG
ncbi:phosphoribosylformylglycinamidine cyclo-ligase [Actinomycetota bacterium]|nr:phosphoribosylformylglycinamidine cyclo-ligase [Actinomycetota bacterium]